MSKEIEEIKDWYKMNAYRLPVDAKEYLKFLLIELEKAQSLISDAKSLAFNLTPGIEADEVKDDLCEQIQLLYEKWKAELEKEKARHSSIHWYQEWERAEKKVKELIEEVEKWNYGKITLYELLDGLEQAKGEKREHGLTDQGLPWVAKRG